MWASSNQSAAVTIFALTEKYNLFQACEDVICAP